jgi:hypothetical protein
MKEHTVTIGRHNGGMSFFIDGVAQPFTSFKINENPNLETMLESAEIEIPAMARQGIMHCWVPIFIDWKGPGVYDFTDMDARIRTVLRFYDENTPEECSKAAIVVRIQAAVFSPPWYIKQSVDANGQPTNLIEFRNPWATVDSCAAEEVDKQRFATEFSRYGSTFAISPGDSFWDTHAVDCLNAIIEHVRQSDYAGRVYGWLPCAFNTNEWFIRTFAAEASCDFSGPAQRAFKEHLRSKGIDCDENPVPSPVVCHAEGHGEFLDVSDPEARRVEEFSLWLNDRIADIILNFARQLRDAYSDAPKLVGFFYGYTLGLSRLRNLSQCGQLAVDRLLNSDDIDFFCSPGEYFYRADEMPFTVSTVMGPFADSAASCGKLVFYEDDHPPAHACGGGASFTLRDHWYDEMSFRRNFAQMWSHGQQLWWYSLGAQWFKEPGRQNIIGKLHDVGKKALEYDRTSVAEVAVVIDERSVATMRFNPLLHQTLLTESHGAFFTTGVPFETFELKSFLKNKDYKRFKMVVFLNLFRVDSVLLDDIEEMKCDGRTLMFSFAPGYLDDSGDKRVFSAESSSRLVGMKLEVEKEPVPLTVWVDPERSPEIFGDDDIRYGWLHIDHGVCPPVLGVVDQEAETVGFLHTGTSGFAVKRHDDWTSVFSSAPCVPPELLHVIEQDAGAHVYTSLGDTVYANRSMICYVAQSRGGKELILPDDEKLEDAITGEKMEVEDGRCSMTMKRHETRIFWRK